jgi:hypothetical protein
MATQNLDVPTYRTFVAKRITDRMLGGLKQGPGRCYSKMMDSALVVLLMVNCIIINVLMVITVEEVASTAATTGYRALANRLAFSDTGRH